ncbi:PP2C family protein-serine/threonine phosphatase [Mycoplasma sp. 480]|uniref:PP2C family protein-serine/threonine phosphatase n=1 Tax=Mycoplasma sp. 480 TaxID=3440155 RepID=UPI003F51A997
MDNYIFKTNKGKRVQNEDSVLILENEKVIFSIVCDGMGGHNAGEIASQITVDTFKTLFSTLEIKEDKKSITNWFSKGINDSIINMNKAAEENEQLLDMGTTMVATIFVKKNKLLSFVNIGDSRIYLYSDILQQLSSDQNLMNYYIEKEKVSFEVASQLPGASFLTSSLGPKKRYTPEIGFLSLSKRKEKSYLIQTTDGVHDFIDKPTLENIMFLKEKDLEYKANKIIETALANDSNDNLTVAIVEIK